MHKVYNEPCMLPLKEKDSHIICKPLHFLLQKDIPFWRALVATKRFARNHFRSLQYED
jgi:hypothetical protein